MANHQNDTKDRELVLSRTIDAPVELVWEVWTQPEHIAQWWGPNGFTNTIDVMDVRPGGKWHLVMHGPDGTDYPNKSIFREVVPHKKLVYEHASYPWILATIEFEAQGDKTGITWHMLFESKEVLMEIVRKHNAQEGQKQNIERLNTYLSKLPAKGYAPVNGLQMYYEIHGSDAGLPLVLIHGGGSTIESSFAVLLPLLSSHRRVIVMELQAHGRTSDREAPESFQQDADDIAALLAWLKVDTADFLGFSNGAHTLMQLAITHGRIIHRMVLVSAAYHREDFFPGFFEGMPKATLADMPASLQEAYLKVAPDKRGLQTMFEKDRNRMIAFTDYNDDDIRRVQIPTLVMLADKDVNIPESGPRLLRLLPDARLVILPGVHGTLIGESSTGEEGVRQARVTVELLKEFFGRLS